MNGINNFVAGIWVGGIAAVIVTLIHLAHTETIIKSKVKLVPETELITDGKTIDTLFIYKEK